MKPRRQKKRSASRLGLVGLVTALCIAGAAALWMSGVRPWRRIPARPNVLLVTIDTLRWDHLGCYGYAGGTSPVLDALAAGGVRFETVLMHVPLTAPSHASILTGLIPPRHGVRDNGAFVLDQSVPTLEGALASAGYHTAGFVSGFPLDRRFGFASGFEVYDDRMSRGARSARAVYLERNASDTTSKILEWLDNIRTRADARPWFAWVHYFDPHAPYDPPPDLLERFPANRYDGEIAFVDQQIGRLLERLVASGEAERTVVLVTADHGESLGDHGEETHGVLIYDSTLRVPWIMAGPGIREGLVSKTVARGVDVMPTLLDLAGQATPAGLDGRSLRPALEGMSMGDEPAYIESLLARRHLGWAPLHGLRSAAWKLIEAPRRELYDLDRDPGERDNVIDAQGERAASLARRLQADMRATAAQATKAPTDREAAERLRALGYLGVAADTPAAPSGRDPKDGMPLMNRLEHGVADSREDPARAIPVLQAVLAEEPDGVLARRYLAIAFAGLRNHAAAIAELDQLRSRDVATPEDLLLLSESLRVTGRTAEARAALEEAARLDPRSPDAALTDARALLAERKPAEAAAAYRKALELSPANPEALLGLADAALAEGDLAGANRYASQVLAGDPSDNAALMRLGLVQARAGQLDLAIRSFQQVAAADPRNGDALAGLGAALARSGRPAEAVPFFQRALDAGAKSTSVLNGLGFAKLESGDREGALAALRSSLALEPNQPRVAEVVAQIAGPGAARPNRSRR